MKIIDSDIFIDVLRGVDKAENWLRKTIEKGDGAFSSMTEAELLSGKACNEKEKREVLIHLLSLFTKIPVDNPVAQIAGDLRRKHGILLPDAIIAATAIHASGTIVTRNKKHFSAIKEVSFEAPY